MEKTRVWIHCRVSEQGERCLLDFQESILRDFAEKLDLKIVGVTKELSSGKNLNSFEYQSMMNCICRKRVDIVLSVTPKRICIYDDIFEEFEMLCNMKDVAVMTLYDINPLKQIIKSVL